MKKTQLFSMVASLVLLATACGSKPPPVPPSEDGGEPDAGVDAGVTFTHFIPGPSTCSRLLLESSLDVGGYLSDRYSWSDSDCRPRSAAMARNTVMDPGGSFGGYLRELRWTAGSSGETRVATGTGEATYNGFGYVVNHYGNGSQVETSKTYGGTYSTPFVGQHHALHEFKLRANPGGPVDVTVHWLFATGRSDPLFAITYDATPAGPDAVQADSRAPYGDFLFEGSLGDIGGVGWGDRFHFTTTSSGPVTPQSSWRYTQPNVVPFTRMWSASVDAEMGIVQTQSFDQNVAGGDYGVGTLPQHCWGKTSENKGALCSQADQVMPEASMWPFQLNQYQLPFITNSHRMAWGSNYGAVGSSTFTSFGRSGSGYPFTSYSVLMVVGEHSREVTLQQVEQVEDALDADLIATEGTVRVAGPAGVARTDELPYAPAGYNHVYATWDVEAAANRATVTLKPRSGTLSSPVFRVRSFEAPSVSSVTLNGEALVSGEHYFASVDSAAKTVWLTLNGTVTGKVTLHIE